MGVFDFLFGAKNPPPVETTNITTTEIPKYIAEPTADIIGEAMDVAKEAYVPYKGPRLAGLTQVEQDAIKQAQAMKGIGALKGAQAYTAATAAGAPAIGGVSQYMTDYQKKVADIAAQKMRDESAMQQQGIAAKAVGAGGLDSTRFAIQEAERQKNLTTGLGDLYTKAQANAYTTALKAAQQDRAQQLRSAMGMGTVGAQAQTMEQADIQQQEIAAKSAQAGGLDSTRFGILEAERQKNLATGIGDLYTKAQASAYSTALKAAQQDRAQQLRSGMGMGTLSAQAQTMEMADVAQQLGIGALDRGLQQTGLDIAYTDFLGERDYPKEQLGFVSNIIRGAPFPSKTTSVGQVPQAQPAPFLQQALGLGMQGVGMAANLGWQPFAK